MVAAATVPTATPLRSIFSTNRHSSVRKQTFNFPCKYYVYAMAVRSVGSVHFSSTLSTADGRINATLLYVNTASSSVFAFEIKCSFGGNRRSEAGVPISNWALSREKLAKFLFSVRRSLLRTERLANK